MESRHFGSGEKHTSKETWRQTVHYQYLVGEDKQHAIFFFWKKGNSESVDYQTEYWISSMRWEELWTIKYQQWRSESCLRSQPDCETGTIDLGRTSEHGSRKHSKVT